MREEHLYPRRFGFEIEKYFVLCEEGAELLSVSENLRRATTEFVTSLCPSSSLSVCPSARKNFAPNLRIKKKIVFRGF
jgi:hypothetical protein